MKEYHTDKECKVKRQNYNIKVQLKAIISKDHAEIKYRNTMQK